MIDALAGIPLDALAGWLLVGAFVVAIIRGDLTPRSGPRVPLVVDVDADGVPTRLPRVPAGPAPGTILPPGITYVPLTGPQPANGTTVPLLGPPMRTIPLPDGVRPLTGADDRTPAPERPSTVPPAESCTCGKAEIHDARHPLPVATVVTEPDPDCPAPACERAAWREKYRDEAAAARHRAANLAQIEAAWRDLVARPLPPIAYLSESPRVEFVMAERVGLAVTAPDGRYGPRVAAELDRAKDAAARRRGVTWPRRRS